MYQERILTGTLSSSSLFDLNFVPNTSMQILPSYWSSLKTQTFSQELLQIIGKDLFKMTPQEIVKI